MLTVQVMYNLYGYEPRGRMIRLDSFEASNRLVLKQLCKPMDTRAFSSFTSFANKFIFLIGGEIDTAVQTNTGEVYDISRNIWMDIPPLQVARSGHSTCSFNN